MPLATLREGIKTLTDQLDALGVGYAPPQCAALPVVLACCSSPHAACPRGDVALWRKIDSALRGAGESEGLGGGFGECYGGGEGVSYATLGANVNRTVAGEEVDNAVLPAWGEALLDVVLVM